MALAAHLKHNARMVEFLLAITCGLVGGFARALLQNGGFVAPSLSTDEDGRRLFDPGFVGTVFIGVIAGLVTWLFRNVPADQGLDLQLLGWALIAGAAGDIVIDYYVVQRYGDSGRQETGETIDHMASATNNSTREVEQAHEERRELQQRIEEQDRMIEELRPENDRLKKSGGSDD